MDDGDSDRAKFLNEGQDPIDAQPRANGGESTGLIPAEDRKNPERRKLRRDTREPTDAKLNADNVQPIRDIPNTEIGDSIRTEVQTGDDDPLWMTSAIKSDDSNRE